MWVTPVSDGSGNTRVDFVQKIKASGKVCLGGGVALLKPSRNASDAQAGNAVSPAKQDGRSKL